MTSRAEQEKPEPRKGKRKPGRANFVSLLEERPLFDRLLPAWELAKQMLLGSDPEPDRPDALPKYCYEIVRRLRATSLGVIPSASEIIKGPTADLRKAMSAEELKRTVEINWEGLGTLAGVVSSGLRFMALGLAGVIEREGLNGLEPEDESRLAGLLASAKYWEGLEATLATVGCQPQDQEGLSQFLAKQNVELLSLAAEVLKPILAAAMPFGQGAIASSASGYAKAVQGLLDEDGGFHGEPPRANTYLFLLTIWPEVKAFQHQEHPITLEQFHGWLEPFMKAGILTHMDLDQLRDVCGDIKLSFRKRGRPRKCR